MSPDHATVPLFSSSQSVVILPVNLSFPNKFDCSNYLLSIIAAYGVEDFLNGSQVIPMMYLSYSMGLTPKYITRKRINGTIQSSISGSVTNEVSRYLYGKQLARELWKTFEEVFASSVQSQIIELRLQIQTVKKEVLSIDDYVMSSKTLANNLSHRRTCSSQ